MDQPDAAAIFAALARRVLDGDGRSAPALRHAVAARPGAAVVPPAIAPAIEKIQRNAYKVTDADIAALKAAGHDEDAIFELTIATALGVALERMDRALATLEKAR